MRFLALVGRGIMKVVIGTESLSFRELLTCLKAALCIMLIRLLLENVKQIEEEGERKCETGKETWRGETET